MEIHKLDIFEKYLTLWVIFCIIAGILLGKLFPGQAQALFYNIQFANVSIPIAILLFFMIYPIMVQIDFNKVVRAGKTPRPVGVTLFVNWMIKPFTMAFFAWIFMYVIFAPFIDPALAPHYVAGMILLGVAPCTAMVLVWSHLSKGNMGHTLVMVAINSLTMLVLYAPLAALLLGVTQIALPWMTIAFAVAVYVGLPLVAGYFTRRELLKKGREWFRGFSSALHHVSIVALLITLVVLFSAQGETIVQQPLIIGMIAVPLIVQIFMIFWIGYGISKAVGLAYEDAAPTAQIGASNHFEVAFAVAITLFGLDSGATLAAVVGVLIEVPLMLTLVKICLRTKHWFPRGGGKS